MKLTVLLLILCSCYATIVNSASKYYDGPIRPYEFGYSIEGNQHRHEKKDENGIIMGEFGFITADGVYHVTVYATDENGNFRIISMKNIKIGLPGENLINQSKAPTVTTTAIPLRTTKAPTYTSRSPPSRKNKIKNLKPSDAVSCSSCLLPRSQDNQSNESEEDNLYPGQNQDGTGNDYEVGADNEPGNVGVTNINNLPPSGLPPRPNTLFTPLIKKIDDGSSEIPKSGQNPQLEGDFRSSDRPQAETEQQGQITGSSGNGKNLPKVETSNVSRTEGQIPNISTSQGQPTGQGRRVEGELGGSTQSRFDGESPQGKSVDEGGLLYKFNYTVGYHGHHEIGDYEGVKDGGYHFVGRDGLRRKIDYLANEFGYQPYLKLEKADDVDVPKEETEKEAGLKGYEFKWFNRPENAKKR